jgi:hypothetical protein
VPGRWRAHPPPARISTDESAGRVILDQFLWILSEPGCPGALGAGA